MLEFSEGLWYIITSGHKESQHFYICASIYFKRKTNVRNRKEIKKRKKNNLPEAWHYAAKLAGPASWPCLSPSTSRQEEERRVADARQRTPGHLPDPLSLSLVPVSSSVSLSRHSQSAAVAVAHRRRALRRPLTPPSCPRAPQLWATPPRRDARCRTP